MPDSNAGLTDMLAGWLPQQRWFPGRGRPLSELAIISDVTLRAGNPALRHLIVEAHLRSGSASAPAGTTAARFQLLIGYRTELPAGLRGALIGNLDGAACYDALHDPELADVLLTGIREQQIAGPLRFVREPGARVFFGQIPDSRVLGAEQSNTSLVFGEQAILKVLRRLFPGANPDLEVADALARLGSARVAAPYGWIETDLDGEPVLLGVLSRFLAGASDGWTLALAGLQRLYARHGAYGREYLTEPVPRANGQPAHDGPADDQTANGRAGGGLVGGIPPDGAPGAVPFLAEARQLGLASAELHGDLARAFGSRPMTAAELAGLVADMNDKLTHAIEMVPELASYERRIRSAYAAVGELAGPVTVQRMHGDYHLGQVLLGPQGWVALDFEGEPAVPLEVRRAPGSALRDVAGMLRSFDYAARHQLVGRPDAAQLAAAADAWVQQCQAAFCAGYAAGGGTDPGSHRTLLRALTLEKAVYEVVYEYRHRPTWLSIPLDFVASA